MRKEKFGFIIILFLVLIALPFILGSCTNEQKTSMVYIDPAQSCCNYHNFKYTSSDETLIKDLHPDYSNCCKYTDEPQACYECIANAPPPSYRSRDIARKNYETQNLIKFLDLPLPILIILLLIINGIVRIITKKDF